MYREKDKILYNFDRYLDGVCGKPDSPRREAFRKNVTASVDSEADELIDKE